MFYVCVVVARTSRSVDQYCLPSNHIFLLLPSRTIFLWKDRKQVMGRSFIMQSGPHGLLQRSCNRHQSSWAPCSEVSWSTWIFTYVQIFPAYKKYYSSFHHGHSSLVRQFFHRKNIPTTLSLTTRRRSKQLEAPKIFFIYSMPSCFTNGACQHGCARTDCCHWREK